MSQAQSALPHIAVKVTYRTRTPFLYCELTGSYQGNPISIAVIETPIGQAETITGLLHHVVQKHDHDERERPSEHKSKEHWSAAIRTNRLNIAPLFNREPQGTNNEAGFVLSWTPDLDAAPSVRTCDANEIIFGRFPDLRPLRLGHSHD
jgi:hypothetical protein